MLVMNHAGGGVGGGAAFMCQHLTKEGYKMS